MKKILLVLLSVLLMVPTIMVDAAKGTNNNNGIITINNASVGKNYKVYQILELESYDTDKGAYTYKLLGDTNKWNEFFNQSTIKGVYVNINEQGIVTWKNDADVKAFVELALEYVKENNISTPYSKEATTSTVTFDNLSLGYYLVESSLGSLLGLTTTKPDASINEKNSVPTIKKEVKENSDGMYKENNTDYIGSTIYFKTTIDVETAGSETKTGAQNYKVYDLMSSGLSLNSDSFEIILNEGTENEVTLVKDTDYTVALNQVKDSVTYTFVIDFADAFEKELVKTDVITIKYTALLNKDAVIGTNGNTNQTYLEYGNSHKTEMDTTKTYTYSFDLVKTNSADEVITGAEFKLYYLIQDPETSKVNKVYINLIKDNGVYRPVIGNEQSSVIEAGNVKIKGLDKGTYYLEETKAPEGYNKLPEDVEVIINDSNLDAVTQTNTAEGEEGEIITTITYEKGGIRVINLTGTELPSTGGAGTVIFMIIGSILVLGFGILLIAKLVMSKMN